jgi:DNA gyrase subunit B
VYRVVSNILESSYAKGELNWLVDSITENSRIREQATEFAKQQRKMKQMSNTGRNRVKVENFVDCRSRNPEERELYIVEGKSALSACKDSRDGGFQALLPITGKPLNCLKHDVSKILSNSVINNIVTTIGTGIDTGDNSTFDISKLQYNKILICTDADVDGYQIRVLLYTVFFRLMPELLREGYVYVVESPLYEIETNKGSRYAYTIDEKDKLVNDLREQGIAVKSVMRSKGLGENNADMMWETTMSPDGRKLLQLDLDVADSNVYTLSNVLFGKDPYKERKGFVFDLVGRSIDNLFETAEGLGLLDDSEAEGEEAV